MKNIYKFLVVGMFFVHSCATSPDISSIPNIVAPTDGRMMVYTATVTIETNNFDDARSTNIEKIRRFDGIIEVESTNHIRARIPISMLNEYLQLLKSNSVISEINVTGTDITEAYDESILKLENMKTVRARYLSLLDRATNVSEILEIEKQLERVNLEIQLLETQKSRSETDVEYSTVNLYFRQKITPGPLGWIFYGLFSVISWLFVWK